ncbi:hypothetical protein VNO78_19652 [Psophocarpus tetragonolobus]|uniref:Pectinesterase inhibitor domain-containing protein n=1 Tax=Psophocarpus tetragonolobus TaxID=3891 RepID=A0AAN9XGF3_PSOTE
MNALVLSLALILIANAPSANGRGHGHGHHQGLVGQICMEVMQDKGTCVELLEAADPKIAEAKDFNELSTAVLELAVSKGVDGQNFLKGLAQLNSSPALEQCAHFHYDGVVASFKSALGELKDDPQTASYDAKVAGDGPDGCDRALAAANINNPAITALNHEISLLSQVAFEAVSKLSG